MGKAALDYLVLRAGLREKILTRTGMGLEDPLPFNCDLKLLRDLRMQLGLYGTMISQCSGEKGDGFDSRITNSYPVS